MVTLGSTGLWRWSASAQRPALWRHADLVHRIDGHLVLILGWVTQAPDVTSTPICASLDTTWEILEGEILAAAVDCIETGQGPPVILVHSSVAGAGQWRGLMDELSDAFRLVALNLYGYGGTDAWSGARDQTLLDQARLVGAVLPEADGRVSIVGHSFGGSVAMKAAELFSERVDRLVLIEPNPFYLLSQAGRTDAFSEAMALRTCIKENGGAGRWDAAAAVFADYWTGAGSWDAMPEHRRSKFASALRPNFHEWDAVMNERTPLAEWHATLPAKTTVISAADTVRSIREIVELMELRCSGWRFETIDHGGHMAVLSRPEIVTPIIRSALS